MACVKNKGCFIIKDRTKTLIYLKLIIKIIGRQTKYLIAYKKTSLKVIKYKNKILIHF